MAASYLAGFFCTGKQAFTAGHGWHLYALHGGLSGRFIAHRAHRLSGRANKCKIVVGANFGKAGIFGQKTIAWMNGRRPAR